MRIMGRRFQWVETSDQRRHATADEDVRAGQDITTLCGHRVVAETWHACPYPSCLDCDTVWRQVDGLPPVPTRATGAGTR